MPFFRFAAMGRSALNSRKCRVFAALAVILLSATAPAQQTPALLDTMTSELQRAFTSLGKQAPGKTDPGKQLPPYFLSYSVSDASAVAIRAQYCAVTDSSATHVRVADVEVRLGEPKLDNTHGNHRGSAVNSVSLPLADDREALARSLWLATNAGYGRALENYLQVKT